MENKSNNLQSRTYSLTRNQRRHPKYKEIKTPYRRKSTFVSLKHEENGFINNMWKDQATRWNQLRFHNEVSINDDLFNNDGLSTLTFHVHGKNTENKLTQINVGL